MSILEIIDALVIIILVIAAERKYRSLLNPVSLYGAFCFVSYIIGTEIFRAVGRLDVSQAILNWSQILSIVNVAAFGFAYLTDFSPVRPVIALLCRCSRPFGLKWFGDKTSIAIPVLLSEFVAEYLLLVLLSGAGLLWFTDPRTAYQLHRSGVGVLWSLSSASLYLSYFVYLLRHGTSIKRVMLGALAYSVCSYFLGSKGLMLGYFIFGLFYVNYHVRPVSRKLVLPAGAMVVVSFIGLQYLFGSASELIQTVMYFDYMPNTQMYLDSPVFSFQYGRVSLSSIWMYVPRFLYPAKPYAYGGAFITELMYPGYAEAAGATPGLVGWVVPYTDFGLIGVILSGLIDGWVSKAAFEMFIHRKSLVSLALAAQIGFPFGIVLFYNAPFPIFWVWLLLQGAILGFLGLAANRSSVEGLNATEGLPR